MITPVKGKIAKLINDASELNTEIKSKEKELENIKNELKTLLEKGSYITTLNNMCTISESSRSEIEPSSLFDFLVKHKQKDEFWKVVKVIKKRLELILSKENITMLDTIKSEATKQITFK